MTNFCTLFDHNYLSRGLILYESLCSYCSDSFTLYILTTDDIAYNWLKSHPHNNIIINSIADITCVYPILEQLKKERTQAEFNWTLSSFSLQFFLNKYHLSSLTYLDADLCFYADPKILFDELDKKESVIITPHNYTPKYDQTATSGRYCVQFMYFKNTTSGNMVLEWWRNECEKCCSAIPKNGKFGDQKYLDDWLSRFSGIVHETKNMGCGIAPWNIQQFNIERIHNKFIVEDKVTRIREDLVFYHFHGVKDFISKNGSLVFNLNDYELSDAVIDYLYKPYIKKLKDLVIELPERDFPIIVPHKKKLPFVYIIFKAIIRSVKMLIKSFIKTDKATITPKK